MLTIRENKCIANTVNVLGVMKVSFLLSLDLFLEKDGISLESLNYHFCFGI